MISPPHSLCHLKRTASAHQPKSRASKGSKSVDELKLHFDPFHMYIHHCWCVFIHCCHAAIQVSPTVSPSAFQGNYCRGDVLRHSSHNVMLLYVAKQFQATSQLHFCYLWSICDLNVCWKSFHFWLLFGVAVPCS